MPAARSEPAPKLIFASSLAVYGGALPPEVGEDTALTPQSSYGTQKAIGELLVNDYSRKGFVDGRRCACRPSSCGPGLPNRAASTFASSMIREPLTGRDAVCPVSPDTVMALASPRRIVAGLAHALDLPAGALGASRSLQLPGFSVSVGEMAEALRRAGGEEAYRAHPLAARPADPGDHLELAASAGGAARRGARLRARQRHRRGRRAPLSRTICRCSGNWLG